MYVFPNIGISILFPVNDSNPLRIESKLRNSTKYCQMIIKKYRRNKLVSKIKGKYKRS